MLQWLKKILCNIQGHDDMFDFSEAGKVKLKCLNCLRETEGWKP